MPGDGTRMDQAKLLIANAPWQSARHKQAGFAGVRLCGLPRDTPDEHRSLHAGSEAAQP